METPFSSPAHRMTPYRLLAVEDNPTIADMICGVAQGEGFEARSVHGAPATDLYESFRPQIVVLDILMPDLDGLEFLQFLDKKGSRTRIVILSGSGKSYRRIAENLGLASDLSIEANIAKPFRIHEVRTVLQRVKKSLDEEINWKKCHA